MHGLNRHYYSMCYSKLLGLDADATSSGLAIDYRKTEGEQGMLLNLHKRGWTEGLKLRDFEEMTEGNEKAVKVS